MLPNFIGMSMFQIYPKVKTQPWFDSAQLLRVSDSLLGTVVNLHIKEPQSPLVDARGRDEVDSINKDRGGFFCERNEPILFSILMVNIYSVQDLAACSFLRKKLSIKKEKISSTKKKHAMTRMCIVRVG